MTALFVQQGNITKSQHKVYSNVNAINRIDGKLLNSNDPMIEDFAFVASYINSTRQYGKCLNFIVKYRYIKSQYFDYRSIHDTAIYYSQPTADIPMIAYWELVNKAFLKNITSNNRYKFQGISSEIQVMNSITPSIHEPGNHGSIITMGNMQPSIGSAPWVNNFEYDCTKYKSKQ
jgi:hypothetical protein